MSPKINIRHKLYSRLEKHAKGFETPEDVITRLLGQVEGLHGSDENSLAVTESTERDYTKYRYEGHVYGKGRLVLAVVQGFIKKRTETCHRDLLAAFRSDIQGSLGVFARIDEAKLHSKRYFTKSNDQIQLLVCTVAVCNQWCKANINKFVEAAKELGADITEMSDTLREVESEAGMKRARKLRGLVIELWLEAGRPVWDFAETKNACLKANDQLKARGLNPAKRFREQVEKDDETYIEQWVLGCHFEWLNPR